MLSAHTEGVCGTGTGARVPPVPRGCAAMVFLPPPPPGLPPGGGASAPSAAAAAGAAAAALLQAQLGLSQGAGGAGRDGPPDAGWTEHQTGDGRKFYFHEELQTSTWEKPDPLMSAEERAVSGSTAWREYRIWDGRIFYYNKETKVSCWSMPPEIRQLRGESTGVDSRPLLQTNAEKRRQFWDLLKAKGVDEAWTWRQADEATREAPQADGLDERTRKQCFAELLSFSLRRQLLEAREKERNAAGALERLIEERFGRPEDLDASYEDAARLLAGEEAWGLVKSDLRREEVFNTVMERLEEKHRKARAERRAERVVRLQRLMASDPELRRTRLRWKDAAAVLARRDELQEEDPPLEALRVWASLRDLRQAAEYGAEAQAKVKPDPTARREERRRRDAFVTLLKETAARGRMVAESTWTETKVHIDSDSRFNALREGPGATTMELFDEFLEDLRQNGPAAFAGVVVPEEKEEEPPAKRARTGFAAAVEPMKAEAQVTEAKKEEEDDSNALDALIAAAAGAEGPVLEEADAADEGGDKKEEADDTTSSSSEEDPLMDVAAKAESEKAARLAAASAAASVGK
mmetsp:Transcript_121878/g.272417  ORF Transcript_121878/g.272417 Transcript_121878/m.272417 type:complete len:578 (+) Transcript_121878:2-1735(+)